MIVSHKYKFIFMHSRRTAGNSFAAHFLDFAGNQDLIIESWLTMFKHDKKCNYNTINRVLSLLAKYPQKAYNLAQIWETENTQNRHIKLLNYFNNLTQEQFRSLEMLGPNPPHASANQVSRLFPTAWDKYFKFAIARNPFTYCISDYYKKWNNHKALISFKEYLYRMADPYRKDPERLVPVPKTNYEIYTINGKIAVDFLGSFENLKQDLQNVCETIGIPFDHKQFPHANKTKPEKDIAEYYPDEESIKLVEQTFARDLSLLDYNAPSN